MPRRPVPAHIAEQRSYAKKAAKGRPRMGWFVVATDKYVSEPMTEEDARREFDRQVNVMGYPFVQLQIVDEFYSPLATVEEYRRSSSSTPGHSDPETIARARQYHTEKDRRYALEKYTRGLNPRSPNPRRSLFAKGAFGPNASALAAARRPTGMFGAPCQVIVGNIGTVYDGPYGVDADLAFSHYCEQSRSGYGRAGGESVTLMCNGEILREHYGENDR